LRLRENILLLFYNEKAIYISSQQKHDICLLLRTESRALSAAADNVVVVYFFGHPVTSLATTGINAGAPMPGVHDHQVVKLRVRIVHRLVSLPTLEPTKYTK
jgi:hypothetical protein